MTEQLSTVSPMEQKQLLGEVIYMKIVSYVFHPSGDTDVLTIF
jgi:hypothetical protein